MIASMPAGVKREWLAACRWRRPSPAQALLKLSLRSGKLPLLRKRPEHALDQRGVAIFLDHLDLAVLDPPDHAILIVVANARFGDVVAARLDHDVVAFGNEIELDGARPHREERPEVAHQAVLDRVTPPEFVRPGILPGHDPDRVLGE